MIPGLSLAITLPFVAGLFLVRTALKPLPGAASGLLRLTLGAGLGLGIGSCTFFLHKALALSSALTPGLFDVLVFLAIIAVCMV